MKEFSPKNTKLVLVTQCDEDSDLVVFSWGDFDDDRILDSEDKFKQFKSEGKYGTYYSWGSFDQFEDEPEKGNIYRVGEKYVEKSKHTTIDSDANFVRSKREKDAYNQWHYQNEND